MIKYIDNIYSGYENQETVFKIESNFEKVAYEFGDSVKEYIENFVKPTKGSNFYLINALGAGETFGANSRGDFFPRNELIKTHKTFETTPAKVFVQHQNKDPKISLGDVLFSNFNKDTDRVELVQRIDWDKVWKFAPQWIKSALQTNQSYNTSMGCHVQYEYCSKCNRKNKLMNDRCDHMKHHMNEFQDGIKIYAVNVGPRFFDNSVVRRGADRIARSQGKIASESNEPISFYFNAKDTITEDKELFGSKKIETFINESNVEKIAETIYNFDQKELNYFCDNFELNEILGTTKVAGAELLPWEYQYVVLNKLGDTKLAEDLWNSKTRFSIPEKYETSNLNLKFNGKVFEKFASYIPGRSFYKHFYSYRTLAKFASESPEKWKVGGGEVLDFIGKSYVDYLSHDVEKSAELISLIPLLQSLFMSLPALNTIKNNKEMSNKTESTHIQSIKGESNAKTVPLLPFVPNPVYHNPLLTADNPALNINVMNKDINVVKTAGLVGLGAAVGAGALGTSWLVGRDKEKEITGNPTAGTGVSGFARKHPIVTGTSGALLTHMGIKSIGKTLGKLAGEELVTDYSNFLKNSTQEDLSDFITKAPEDLILNL